MFIGHFALAYASKRVASDVSVGNRPLTGLEYDRSDERHRVPRRHHA
jgi:hypothetical protein